MPQYVVNDWEYVTLINAVVSGSIVAPTAISGSFLSEIIDLSSRHRGLTALILDGFNVDIYYATEGDDTWTLAAPEPLTEHILTAFDGEICTAYDIAYIENLQTEVDYRHGQELNTSNLVGFAKVGYSTIADDTYTEAPILDGIFVENNYIRIAHPELIPGRTNISIVYLPTIPVISGIGRYLLLKVIFKSMDAYVASITVDFKLNTFESVMSGVPTFYRRI